MLISFGKKFKKGTINMSIFKLFCQLSCCAVIAFGIRSESYATGVTFDSSGNLAVIGTSGIDVIEFHTVGDEPAYGHRSLRVHYVDVIGRQRVHIFHNVNTVEVTTFDGDDRVTFSANCTVQLFIDTGAGHDEVIIEPASGAALSFEKWGHSYISTGSGEDYVRIRGFVGHLSIDTGANDDDIWITHATALELDISTSTGSDWVQLWSCNVSVDSTIGLGSGRDALNVVRTTFGGSAVFNGGSSSEDTGNAFEVDFRELHFAHGFEEGNLSFGLEFPTKSGQ